MALKASMKILIADDSATNRQNVKSMLTKLGLKNITEASDGAVAWSKIQENSYEFIIADWELSKTPGLELLKLVRSHENLKKTPFLMTTEAADQQIIVQSVKNGVNNVLVRPFSSNGLTEKISKIFNQK